MSHSANSRLKFARFYESVKRFILDTELSRPEEVVGSDIQTIEKLEAELSIKLPDFLFSFFEYFGEEIIVERTDHLLHLTIKDFKKAFFEAKNKNIIERLRDKKGLLDYYENDLVWYMSDMFNLNNILVIISDAFRDKYGFVDTTNENPVLGYIYQNDYFESEEKTFSNFIRHVLFNVIKYSFEEIDYSIYNDLNNYIHRRYIGRQKAALALKSKKVIWADYYFNLAKGFSFYDDRKFIDLRNEFYIIISKKEMEMDKILTIDEFELAFIEFLKERNFDTSE